MELDRVPLWDRDHDHVAVRQVVEYFASHLYLPRLQDPAGGSATPPPEPGGGSDDGPETDPHPTRFHGCVTLDATRAGRDASQVADEVISHLAGLVGANVRVMLEIDAEIPDGAPDHVVRTVTENSRTLKFDSHGFERE